MRNTESNLKVHFIGVGGVSMSSLALYLLRVGFTVSGSDTAKSIYTEDLSKAGCEVHIGHKKENVFGAQVVVYNSAISEENEELEFARAEKLFVLSRAELLKMVSENFATRIGVCGCNGKTTVTCMLAHIFKCAKKRFTAHIGGYDNEFKNSVSRGTKYFISEVCEYKKNIEKFNSTVGVCLNTGEDHLECYNGKDELIACYFDFLSKAEKAVVWAEDENLKSYAGDNKVTFGYGETCDYRITDEVSKAGKYSFKIIIKGGEELKIKLKVNGRHNVLNATASIATAISAGIKKEDAKRGVEEFTGTMRRFETIGEINGGKVIADYAHHPEEITASFKTAKEIAKGRIFVVFQPHTYSRTLNLKDKFLEVLAPIERLIIFKTYPAREEYIAGGSAYDLFCALDKKGVYTGDVNALISYLKLKVRRSDLVLVLGAGDLYDLLKARL